MRVGGAKCIVSSIHFLYMYIPICNTKQNIKKTKYALLHHSRTFTNV